MIYYRYASDDADDCRCTKINPKMFYPAPCIRKRLVFRSRIDLGQSLTVPFSLTLLQTWASLSLMGFCYWASSCARYRMFWLSRGVPWTHPWRNVATPKTTRCSMHTARSWNGMSSRWLWSMTYRFDKNVYKFVTFGLLNHIYAFLIILNHTLTF